jgi:aminoglycoside phosphotransferase family enzyme
MLTRDPTLGEKVAFLRDPRSYADGTAAVESSETHFAWVFLTARHAYKLKKPVHHEQLDYVTLAARERGCRDEVRLNRRLAPAIYEGVVPLSQERGQLVLGAGERVCDWLVKMQRLPSARMLDHALRLDAIHEDDLEHIAFTLARFFDQAGASAMEGLQYLAKIRAQISANREAIRAQGTRLPQNLIAEVERRQLEFLSAARAEVAARGQPVVEGHGDLRAEHVYLGPPVAVIDCLEFDRELRLLDPAEEIALLMLEIEQLGRADLAEGLSRHFRSLSAHSAPAGVCDFYMSHRAATRAKLAAWHLSDAAFADPRPWIARTESLLAAAAAHAEQALQSVTRRGAANSVAEA